MTQPENLRARDGTSLAYRSAGPPADPAIVFVHGLGLSARCWEDVFRALADRYRVVAYDLRGHGGSELPETGNYSLEAHAADLASLLDEAVPAGGRAVLVANSFGGAIVLAHAHTYRDPRVAGVVFAGSSGSAVTLPGFPLGGAAPWADQALRWAYRVALRAAAAASQRLRGADTITRALVRRSAFAPGSPTYAVDEVRRDFFATHPEALAHTTLASGSRDGSRFAASLAAPALVLWGDRDPEIPLERVETLMETLPDAERITFEGAAHMLPITHAERVAREIDRFVARIDQAQASQARKAAPTAHA